MIGLFIGSVQDEFLLVFSSLFSSSFWRLLFFAYVHDPFSLFCFYHLKRVSFSTFLTFISSLLNQYAAFIRQEIEENIIAWGVFRLGPGSGLAALFILT